MVLISIRYSHAPVYVRAVEDTKRVAVEAIKLSARKNVQVWASWKKQPPAAVAASRCGELVEQRGIEPLTSALRMGFMVHCGL